MDGNTVIDRTTGLPLPDSDADGRLLRWLYKSAAGRRALGLCLQRGALRVVGALADSGVSRTFIGGFARKRGIPLTRGYASFNDFFSREYAGAFPADAGQLACPCEAHVTAWASADEAEVLCVKGQRLTLDALTGADASRWRGGALYQLSLTTAHLHRVLAFDDCRIVRHVELAGAYHSTHRAVRAGVPDVYFANHRVVQTLQTKRFGAVLLVAVASMLVGGVRRVPALGAPVGRGETLDRFTLGGSAVLMAFEPGAVAPHDDLLRLTREGYAAYVRPGEGIGTVGGV